MNAYDIEIEYDQENDNYYAEHEFAYPSKRVRLNIDTDNSLWPTDESNSMTITIPSNPQTDTNNTWDDTTKTLTLTNLDQNTLITNNQNPTFNYATDLNINLSNYQSSTPSSTKIDLTSYSFGSGNYLFSNMITSTEQTIQINYRNAIFFIRQNNTNNSYYLFLKTNLVSSSAIPQSLENGDKYIIINSDNGYIELNDDNNNAIIRLLENDRNDRNYSITELYKSKFNIVF